MNTPTKATSEPVKDLYTQHYSRRETSTPIYFNHDEYYTGQQKLHQYLITHAMNQVRQAVKHKYKIIEFFCDDTYENSVPQDIIRLISTIYTCFCGYTRCICCIKQKKK